MASTSGVDCLGLEDLAAFADGRLTGAERQRAVEHVADCERCYDIFSEVVRFQEEEEGEEARADDRAAGTPLAAVVLHPKSRSWLWPSVGGAVAAAALVLLVAAPLLRDAPPPGPDWDKHRWAGFLSGDGGQWGEQEAAFRLGVLSVDLEVALNAGRADRAIALTFRLEEALRSYESADPQRALYGNLQERLDRGEKPAALARRAATARGYLEALPMPEPYYALGRWVEQGRAAALVGNRRFFRRETRPFLRQLEGVELPPNVALEMETVRSLISRGPGDHDLVPLERSLAAVIAQGGAR